MTGLLARLASTLTTPLHMDDFVALVNPLSSGKQLRGIVTAVEREAPGTVTIHFRPGRGWIAHEAGQWARVGVEIDGVRHWRSYSLSTAGGGDPAITVTDLGRVSGTLVRRTKPGDVLYLDPPQGDFVLPEHPRPLLMITGGSGLTPVMSMVRTLTARRADADIVLIHSARTADDALFRDELASLAESHPGLSVIWWFTGERGRLDLTSTDTVDELCPDWRTRAAYVCGPAGLIGAAESLWSAANPENPVTIERFTAAVLDGPPGEGGLVTFTRSDKEVDADGAAPLLEIGEDAGITMPSGCRMGICRTCLTPLAAGRVRDLTTGEVHGEPGDLIRTCVSAAAGDVQLDI